jgi:hypothetical protein
MLESQQVRDVHTAGLDHGLANVERKISLDLRQLVELSIADCLPILVARKLGVSVEELLDVRHVVADSEVLMDLHPHNEVEISACVKTEQVEVLSVFSHELI